jgi:hypothetical protein
MKSPPLLPSPLVLKGRGAGGEGFRIATNGAMVLARDTEPLTPDPSPPEYRG